MVENLTNSKPEITFDDVNKLDIRICEVISCERVPNTEKLLVMKINTGFDERTVVTNLGSTYGPEEFTGKKLSFILNLSPVKIRGIESQAMIVVAVSPNDGKVELIESKLQKGSIIL